MSATVTSMAERHMGQAKKWRQRSYECNAQTSEPKHKPPGSVNSGSRRLVSKFPFFRLVSSGSKIHARHLRERWRGCGKMGKLGLEKQWEISPKLSHVSPIFHPFLIKFTHFFVHFP